MYIQPSDFVGKWEIHQGMYSSQNLVDYINRYTPIYMSELLGAELYKRYLNDQGQSPCFIKINEPFVEDLTPFLINKFGFNNGLLVSDGVKDMLLGFLYFEIMKDSMTQGTIYGEVIQRGEVSNKTTSLSTLIYNRYNEAIRTFNAIQYYILMHMNDFGNEIVQYQVLDFGTNYVVENDVELLAITSNGVDASINILDVDAQSGAVVEFEIANDGKGYEVNDMLIADGGDNNFTLKVTKVGDTFENFNGVKKLTAYWL